MSLNTAKCTKYILGSFILIALVLAVVTCYIGFVKNMEDLRADGDILLDRERHLCDEKCVEEFESMLKYTEIFQVATPCLFLFAVGLFVCTYFIYSEYSPFTASHLQLRQRIGILLSIPLALTFLSAGMALLVLSEYTRPMLFNYQQAIEEARAGEMTCCTAGKPAAFKLQVYGILCLIIGGLLTILVAVISCMKVRESRRRFATDAVSTVDITDENLVSSGVTDLPAGNLGCINENFIGDEMYVHYHLPTYEEALQASSPSGNTAILSSDIEEDTISNCQTCPVMYEDDNCFDASLRPPPYDEIMAARCGNNLPRQYFSSDDRAVVETTEETAEEEGHYGDFRFGCADENTRADGQDPNSSYDEARGPSGCYGSSNDNQTGAIGNTESKSEETQRTTQQNTGVQSDFLYSAGHSRTPVDPGDFTYLETSNDNLGHVYENTGALLGSVSSAHEDASGVTDSCSLTNYNTRGRGSFLSSTNEDVREPTDCPVTTEDISERDSSSSPERGVREATDCPSSTIEDTSGSIASPTPGNGNPRDLANSSTSTDEETGQVRDGPFSSSGDIAGADDSLPIHEETMMSTDCQRTTYEDTRNPIDCCPNNSENTAGLSDFTCLTLEDQSCDAGLSLT